LDLSEAKFSPRLELECTAVVGFSPCRIASEGRRRVGLKAGVQSPNGTPDEVKIGDGDTAGMSFRLGFDFKCSPTLNSIGKCPEHKLGSGSGFVFPGNVNPIFSIMPTRLEALLVVWRTPGGRC